MEVASLIIQVLVLILLLRNEFIPFSRKITKKQQKKENITSKNSEKLGNNLPLFKMGENVFDTLNGKVGTVIKIDLFDINGQMIYHYTLRYRGGMTYVHDSASLKKVTDKDVNFFAGL